MSSGIFPPAFGSMWFIDLAATLLIIWGGVQHAHTREVSNWITIPIFVLGLAFCVFHIITRDEIGFPSVILILLVTGFTRLGWMGGADWKVLCGLIGFWPQAAFAAVVCAGLWATAEMIRTHSLRARIPAVSAFAAGIALTFFVDDFRMLSIIKV